MNNDRYVYITDSNYRKIVDYVSKNIKETEDTDLTDIFNANEHIDIFSSIELKFIKSYKLLCQNTEVLEELAELNKNRSKNMVFKFGAPAYHYSDKCAYMYNDYFNVLIPNEIIERGIDKTKEFETFIKVNKAELMNLTNEFEEFINDKFSLKNISIRRLIIRHENSGSVEFSKEKIERIFFAIRALLKEYAEFVDGSDIPKWLIKKYKHAPDHRFLKYAEINDHEDKKAIANKWVDLKKQLMSRCEDYYKAVFHNDMMFTEKSLLKLGFKHCSGCRLH